MKKIIVCFEWRLIVLLTIGFHFFAHGQEISHLDNHVKGFWVKHSFESHEYKDWNAEWIWLPEEDQSDLMLARKSFELSEVPKTSELKITASSKYELFVNGKYVLQGPARCAPHHQSFDILDVTSLLKKGSNVIAVKVHYQRGTKSYELEGRAGLLLQLKLENETIVSNNTWKVIGDASWDPNSPQLNRFQLVVADRVDIAKRACNFQALDFDDTTWSFAQPLLRNAGWPAQKKNEKASHLTSPWVQLVPRDIPYLKEQNVDVKEVLLATEISESTLEKGQLKLSQKIDHSVFKKGVGGAFKISPASKGTFNVVLFDFGKVINGMPKLLIEGTKGSEVHVLSAPFVVDDVFTHKIVASDYHDIIKLSGSLDSWQAMYFKPTRYMAIAISGNTTDVKIHHIGLHQIEYPFQKEGTISAPEAAWVEDYWKASTKTIEVCTTDAFTDNYRERRQYAQTGYYAALGNYFTFGDYDLQKRYLIQVAQEQLANGLMPAYAPLTGDDYMVILDSNCLWLRSLYNYFLYSGDLATVEYLMPYAERLMALLNSFTNEQGLLENPPYPYWLDHTLNDRRGANLCLNGHFLGAVEDFAEVKKWLGDQEESIKYKEQAKAMRRGLAAFWDEEKQLFADALIDGKRSNQFSEHANAMALSGGIATQEQANVIAEKLLKNDKHNYIKRADGVVMVSPAMSYFLHKGLADYGFEAEALELFKNRFSKMLAADTNQTLWEEWWRNGTGRTGKFQERTRSDAQTESVFPPALISAYILGVEVIDPGMERIRISKPTIAIGEISSEIPTPNGMLKMKWNPTSKELLTIDVPSNIIVELDIESFNSKAMKINHKSIDASKTFVELNTGKHHVKIN